MTKKEITNRNPEETKSFRLSIQVSLNGLSFCIIDPVGHDVALSDQLVLDTPYAPEAVQEKLASLLERHKVPGMVFSEVTVTHRNDLFALVPKALFDSSELRNYLKFNTTLLADDHIEYDEIDGFDIVVVYVPFVNANNYVYELFGSFEFQHSATVLLGSLLKESHGNGTTCYVYVSEGETAIAVIAKKKLLLYNNFHFNVPEDFLYYVLYTYEQLKLDTESTPLRLFGSIDEGDDLYGLCYKYIKDIEVFVPSTADPLLSRPVTVSNSP